MTKSKELPGFMQKLSVFLFCSLKN